MKILATIDSVKVSRQRQNQDGTWSPVYGIKLVAGDDEILAESYRTKESLENTMLHNLYVKNLALIDEMEVEFHNGLNILTGETGAGKSIILGSINLALGGRYSSEMLRNEEEAGYFELTFFVENKLQVELLKEEDVFPEEGSNLWDL